MGDIFTHTKLCLRKSYEETDTNTEDFRARRVQVEVTFVRKSEKRLEGEGEYDID